MDNKKISFTIVTAIIGFMIAIQFQTVKEPSVRDTRDTWQLREDIVKENELRLKLIQEIRSNEEKIAKYETELKQNKEQVLRDTLEELRKEAGLSKVTGMGIILTIEPIDKNLIIGESIPAISPDLLKRLVNDLNMNGAQYISINEHRIINTTVIREINGETKIDGYSLSDFPIKVKVITENVQTAKKLYNLMEVSRSADEFFVDNLKVTVIRPNKAITIPPYQKAVRIRNMEPVEPEKEDI